MSFSEVSQCFSSGNTRVPQKNACLIPHCVYCSWFFIFQLRLSLYPHPAEISVPLVVGTVPQSKFLYCYWYYAGLYKIYFGFNQEPLKFLDLRLSGLVTGGECIEPFWPKQNTVYCTSGSCFDGKCVPYHIVEINYVTYTVVCKSLGTLVQQRHY